MSDLVLDNPDLCINDFVMAKNMAELLNRIYPGHLWAVTCDGFTGLATLRNMALSGVMAYVLHLDAQYSASMWDKMVMRAGGEVLERYRLARQRFNLAHWSSLPTDFAGRFMAAT